MDMEKYDEQSKKWVLRAEKKGRILSSYERKARPGSRWLQPDPQPVRVRNILDGVCLAMSQISIAYGNRQWPEETVVLLERYISDWDAHCRIYHPEHQTMVRKILEAALADAQACL